MPDLESARGLIATLVIGLGLPIVGLTALSIAERWSWRWTILLSASALALGVLHAITPAYATEPVAVAVAPTSDPLMSLLLSVAGGQTPSWVTVILVAGLLLRQINGIISKGVKVTIELVHTIPEGAPRLDLHHHEAPRAVLPPDEGTDERSGVRRRPRI